METFWMIMTAVWASLALFWWARYVTMKRHHEDHLNEILNERVKGND